MSAALAVLLLLSMWCTSAAALRVLGIQLRAVSGVTEANLQKAKAVILANPGHDLYVLPELSSHGYDNAVLARMSDHAEETSGRICAFFGRLAREAKAFISFGFLRYAGDSNGGSTTICQAVVDPSGALVLAYDKMHLCDMGKCSEVGHGLTRGSAAGVFEVGGVRIGVTICYDLRFPELFRRLAWDLDCDLILHPSAFVRDATFPCYHPFVTTRAVENSVYILSVNHAGADFGDSIAVPPWVGPVPGLDSELATATLGVEEGVLPLVVDAAHLRAVRAAYPYRRNVHPLLRPGGGARQQAQAAADSTRIDGVVE